MTTHYPDALSACFDYAGRELVESWLDELGDDAAEQKAQAHLIEIAYRNEIISVTFGTHIDWPNTNVTIEH